MKVQRNTAVDTLIRDGEMAVLLEGGNLVRLTDLSATIYDLATEPLDVDELASVLSGRFGEPEQRTTLEATQDAVAELVRHRIIRFVD